MKKSLLATLLLSFMLTGCGLFETPDTEQIKQMAGSGLEYLNTTTRDFVQNNEYAQQAQQAANEAYTQAQQVASGAYAQAQAKANELAEQAKAEAQAQYQQLKDDAKAEVKNQVNKKIDQTFERF